MNLCNNSKTNWKRENSGKVKESARNERIWARFIHSLLNTYLNAIRYTKVSIVKNVLGTTHAYHFFLICYCESNTSHILLWNQYHVCGQQISHSGGFTQMSTSKEFVTLFAIFLNQRSCKFSFLLISLNNVPLQEITSNSKNRV